MKIGVVTNDKTKRFSKNWDCKQTNCCVQRSMQPSRTEQRSSRVYSNNSNANKEVKDIFTKSNGSVGCNSKQAKINFNGLKTAWTNKEIPLVTRGYYGDRLTFDNVGIKTINGCQVLVGNKKKGHVTDKDIVDYFMQFVRYPNYRRYILDSIDRVE